MKKLPFAANWTPLPGCPGAMYLGPRSAMPFLDAIEFRMRIWFPPMLEVFYVVDTVSRIEVESFFGVDFCATVADRMVGNYKAFMRGERWVRS
jgi:hypothetical protein